MKSLKQIFLPLLLALFTLSVLSAQGPGQDLADKMAKEAKELADKIPEKDKSAKQAADEVADAIKKAGEDNPKDADKVKKAVESKLKEIRDRKSKKDVPGGNDPKVKGLIKSLLKKLFGDEGETTAGKIKEELDGTGLDLDGNSEDDKRKGIKDAADAAADKDPHDAKAVKDAVKKKIEDEIKEVDGSKGKKSQGLWDWLRRVREWLRGKNLLVSIVTPSNNTEWVSVSGTGRTTGHVATLTVRNPQSTAITAKIGPCFLPSSGGYQPYITLPTTVRLLPGETLQVALLGYCADVFMPPLPKGHTMACTSDLIRLDEIATEATVPIVSPIAVSSSVLDPMSKPSELALVLFNALEQISQAYDGLSQSGTISTPFSGSPEKERESVIQQTFWIYTSALSGKSYQKADFHTNILKQYEAANGQPLSKASQADKDRIETGVNQLWDTFQLVGVEAKVLSTHSK